MTKRLLVLLLATIAFSGGLYAFRGKKANKRPAAAITTNIPALKLPEPAPELPSPASHASHSPHLALDVHLVSRVAGLVALALALGAIAYFGLGKGSEPARASELSAQAPDSLVSSASPDFRVAEDAFQKTLRQEEVASLRARSAAAAAPPPAAPTAEPTAAPPAPAPTPAVAAEVAVPAAAPAAAPAFTIPADGIEAIICALPWPCQQAINVAACESGRDIQGRLDGNWASNGNNYGLFQINGIHAGRWPDFWTSWMDPAKNAQWAYEIYAQQGWAPWDCSWAAYY
jgi:hypothetical protein